MIVNNTLRQKNICFGASEQKTAQLVQKWTQKKRPDKLILMLTRDDFPSAPARSWADFNAFWRDKESSTTKFFREFNKKFVYLGIGQTRIRTEAPVVRPELFQKAIAAVKELMAKDSGAQIYHQDAAKELYEKHSTPLEYYISRRLPELGKIFSSNTPK